MKSSKETSREYAISSNKTLADSFPKLSICGVNVSLSERKVFSNYYVGARGARYDVSPNAHPGVIQDKNAIVYTIVSQRGIKLGTFCLSNGSLVECERV